MISLISQPDRRAIQHLSFCYLCGKDFEVGDSKNRDHLPPQSIFQTDDRDPLILPTHEACNGKHTLVDEKMGQLIALRYGKASGDPRKLRLKISKFVNAQSYAVKNLDMDEAIWRWISGFHAALYRNPVLDIRNNCSLVTPFARAKTARGQIVFDPIRPQHLAFVQAIKDNRARNNLDQICYNKGKFIYECVWDQADNNGPWLSLFALDVYDWKDLGKTIDQLERGCAGYYIFPSGVAPPNASRGAVCTIRVPNYNSLDPFAP